MGRTLEQLMESLEPETRAEIDRRTEEILVELDSLTALRKKLSLSQEMLAERLGVSQPAISKLENQTDMLLSTLVEYVGALGGELSLTIELPNQERIRLQSFQSLLEGAAESGSPGR